MAVQGQKGQHHAIMKSQVGCDFEQPDLVIVATLAVSRGWNR